MQIDHASLRETTEGEARGPTRGVGLQAARVATHAPVAADDAHHAPRRPRLAAACGRLLPKMVPRRHLAQGRPM